MIEMTVGHLLQSDINCSIGDDSPDNMVSILETIPTNFTPFQAREFNILSGVLAKIQRRKNKSKR